MRLGLLSIRPNRAFLEQLDFEEAELWQQVEDLNDGGPESAFIEVVAKLFIICLSSKVNSYKSFIFFKCYSISWSGSELA